MFGAMFSGRPPELAGMEQMVGLFINNLPIRVQFAADDGSLGWLRRLQDLQSEITQYTL